MSASNSAAKKIIFISCVRGIIARNILFTKAFSELTKRDDITIIIIAPESRVAILREEFARPNVEVVGVKTSLTGGEKFLWTLATNLLETETRDVQRFTKWQRDRNAFDYVGSRIVGFLGRFRVVRSCFRALAVLFLTDPQLGELIEQHHPVLVFATDVYTLVDAKLIRTAARHKIRSVGMVRSWDNITSKTLLIALPDQLVVNSSYLKDEVVRYGDMKRERVAVVGVPHYDQYRFGTHSDRETFFRQFGLDHKRKMILFTPPSDNYLKSDPVTPMVLKALEALDAQILVRMPLVGKAEFGGYTPGRNVVFDVPENSEDFIDVHMNRAQDQHLADSLYHADVVVTWASTVIVDGVVFDKPIVLVGFDATPRRYGESILQYYDYEHQRHILASRGAKLAKNTGELVRWVEEYLGNPEHDHLGRAKIAEDYCGPLDGASGHRLAELLLSMATNQKL